MLVPTFQDELKGSLNLVSRACRHMEAAEGCELLFQMDRSARVAWQERLNSAGVLTAELRKK